MLETELEPLFWDPLHQGEPSERSWRLLIELLLCSFQEPQFYFEPALVYLLCFELDYLSNIHSLFAVSDVKHFGSVVFIVNTWLPKVVLGPIF